MSLHSAAETAIFSYPKDTDNQPSTQGTADLFKHVRFTFNTAALLLADTTLTYSAGQATTVSADDYVVGGEFAYKVVANGTSGDSIVSTAGGVELQVQSLAGAYHVAAFGAAGDASTDDTAKIQAAIDTAYANNIPAVIVTRHAVDGTITMKAGVTLRGDQYAAEYYPAGPGSAISGSYLYKDSGGTAGPIVEMTTGAGLANIYLKHEKTNGATTGIIRMGATGSGDVCYNTNITNVAIYGHLTTDVTGSNTCYGIYYPDSTTPSQRYFNRGNNIFVTNCDVAFHLGEESNANNYSNIITRQCYHHFELDGNSASSNPAAIDNVFTGLQLANIGSLATTQEKCFVLKNGAKWNSFVGYTTEINGLAFDIDSTSTLNTFIGRENEVDASYAPPSGSAGEMTGNAHSRWAQPVNISQFNSLPLPSLTTGAKWENSLLGGKQHHVRLIGTGDGLPALNGAGTLVAATAHSRSIIQLNNAVFSKANQPNFAGVLTVWCQAAGTSGNHMARVRFGYVCTNTSTSAGNFEVYEVYQTPSASSYIAGLKFIDGATGSTGFRIAMVGGNLSAALATRVAVSLELDVFKATGVNRELFVNHGFDATACTANDVTDAIDMLTVAETVV